MNDKKIGNSFITLAVFAMFTVAVVASQARTNQLQMAQALEPVVQDVTEHISTAITLRLDRGLRPNALQGHN